MIRGISLACAALLWTSSSDAADFADAPIIYGQGAGGISFRTPREEALKLLPAPHPGPEPGIELFAPGLIVVWSDDPPEVPYAIFVERGYRGKLTLPPPYGAIGIGSPLGAHFEQGDEEFALLRGLHRALEGKPADYDCLAAETCSSRITPDGLVVLRFPMMNLLIRHADKTVLRFVIKRNQDLAPSGNRSQAGGSL